MPKEVPGYRDLKPIGKGGFSVVYQARQETLNRSVALKVLLVHSVDAKELRRFKRECEVMAELSAHPNIVTVFDNGTTRSGNPYIAMEHCEHGSLSDRLRRDGPLPVAEVLRIGVKMAGALAATHESNVLHRDVKPQNILVTRYQEPALTDFGIAGLIDTSEVSTGQAFTPSHAAPEVVNGNAPSVRSDIYSLGSTLYQLLAGRSPFKGPTKEPLSALLVRIMHHPPPPMPRNDVPSQVMDAILRAMAKAPEHRFQSAVEFARQLQQLQRELGLAVTDAVHSGAVTTEVTTSPPAPSAPTFGTTSLSSGETPEDDSGTKKERRLHPLLTASVIGGVVLGLLAILAPNGRSKDAPTPSPSPHTTVPTAPSAQQPISPEQLASARPRNVQARDLTERAVLTWTVPPPAQDLGIIVQPLPEGSAHAVEAGTGGRTATVTGLRPGVGYCFRVGAVLQLNQDRPATISWSNPVCIRGARVQPG